MFSMRKKTMQIYEILFYLKMRKMRGFAFWTNIWEKRAINLITLTNIVKKKWMKQRHSGNVYAVFFCPDGCVRFMLCFYS